MREKLGPYRILRRLAQGGMGEVLLAEDERHGGRRVAIKRVRSEVAQESAHRQRFHREARLAAGLDHPNIVKIFDILEGGSGEALVMEYVDGRSLSQLAAAGALEPVRVVAIAAQIARGLAAAHAAGLVHRDLKGSNVLVGTDGRVKILDFGLAKPLRTSGDSSTLSTLTEAGTIVGTLRSMSPEQALGEEVDHRSDLFSLGVLLFELLAGKAPFRGSSPAETLQALVSQPPPSLPELAPGLPEELYALVAALLVKDPRRRLADASEVADALEGLAARPFTASPVPRPPRSETEELSALSTVIERRPRPRRRAPWPWIVLAALVLAAVAAAAWLVFF
jgi:serine/threonine-protein kinase